MHSGHLPPLKQRFLAVCVFLLIGVLFIFLSSLFFKIYHSELYSLLAAGTFIAPKAVITIITAQSGV